MSRIILPSYVVDKIEKEDAERAEQEAKENHDKTVLRLISDLQSRSNSTLDCKHSREIVRSLCAELIKGRTASCGSGGINKYTKKEIGRIISDVLLGPGEQYFEYT